MSIHRFAAKRDANESDLFHVAEQLAAVLVRAPPLDAWSYYRGLWVPVEVKNPEGLNRYTRAQERFIQLCAIAGAPMFTWRTSSDVLRDLGAK